MSEEAPPKLCPVCGKLRVSEFAPFCSKRCEAIDLGRWLKGAYVIPGPPVEETGEDDE